MRSPIAKSVLERRLTLRSDELQGVREKCKNTEFENQTLKIEVESLRKGLKRLEENLGEVTAERNRLEAEVPALAAQNNVSFQTFVLKIHKNDVFEGSFESFQLGSISFICVKLGAVHK